MPEKSAMDAADHLVGAAQQPQLKLSLRRAMAR